MERNISREMVESTSDHVHHLQDKFPDISSITEKTLTGFRKFFIHVCFYVYAMFFTVHVGLVLVRFEIKDGVFLNLLYGKSD